MKVFGIVSRFVVVEGQLRRQAKGEIRAGFFAVAVGREGNDIYLYYVYINFFNQKINKEITKEKIY